MADELELYAKIASFTPSTTTSPIFIFLRWSPHFVSYYTKQYIPDRSLTQSTLYFNVLHLLPIDAGSSSTFTDLVANYEQHILINATNQTLTDDVRRSATMSGCIANPCCRLVDLRFERAGKRRVPPAVGSLDVHQPGDFECRSDTSIFLCIGGLELQQLLDHSQTGEHERTGDRRCGYQFELMHAPELSHV